MRTSSNAPLQDIDPVIEKENALSKEKAAIQVDQHNANSPPNAFDQGARLRPILQVLGNLDEPEYKEDGVAPGKRSAGDAGLDDEEREMEMEETDRVGEQGRNDKNSKSLLISDLRRPRNRRIFLFCSGRFRARESASTGSPATPARQNAVKLESDLQTEELGGGGEADQGQSELPSMCTLGKRFDTSTICLSQNRLAESFPASMRQETPAPEPARADPASGLGQNPFPDRSAIQDHENDIAEGRSRDPPAFALHTTLASAQSQTLRQDEVEDETERNGRATVRRIAAGVEDMVEDVKAMSSGTELCWRIGKSQ